MQDGKFSKINKHAGWNKGMQVGLFLFSLVKIKVLSQKFLKLIKVQDGISMCRLDFFKKLIRFAAWLFGTVEYAFSQSLHKPTFHTLGIEIMQLQTESGKLVVKNQWPAILLAALFAYMIIDCFIGVYGVRILYLY